MTRSFAYSPIAKAGSEAPRELRPAWGLVAQLSSLELGGWV